ncbi:MAG TPA: nicotinate-nucleotide adenylyltransferase [Candidatus Limnocylindrales bacterium]
MSEPAGPEGLSITDARRAREAAAAARLSHDRPRPVVAGSIGLLGGTFDPVHLGHLALAEEAREALGLERVLFVPAGLPPHKPDQPISAPAHRLAMVELAVADNPAFGVSTVEIERSGPSYTVDTVERVADSLRESGATPDLTFILSAEAFGQLLSWRQPHRLLSLCRMAVSPREGYRMPTLAWLEEHFPGQEDRVVFLDGPHLGHSASDIRRRVAQGRSIRYHVPPAVAAYIADHHLYTDDLWRKN